MTFHNPSFLWALFLVAIPIIVHLFNFRRYKRVIFSNVEMLKELHTESKKTRQLKKWLVLLVRMIAIAALVFAFARPYIPLNSKDKGRELISVYIDNSQSMRAEGENGLLFEQAKNTARELLANLPKDAEVKVLDNRFSSSSRKVYSPVQALKLVDDTEIDYRPNDIKKVIQKSQVGVQSGEFQSQHTYVISDFQSRGKENSLDIDTSVHIHLVRLSPLSLQNLSIDTAWLDEPIARPGSPVKLKVKVSNNGDEDVESTTLVLKINGIQQGVESFGVSSNSSQVLQMDFASSEKGWVQGEFSLTDVPVTFDNQYYFSLHLKPSIDVLQIGNTSGQLSRVFEGDKTFNLLNSAKGSVDYESFAKFDLIVLNELETIESGLSEQLKLFVESGGILLVIPSIEPSKYSAFSANLNVPFYLTASTKDLSISADNLNSSFFRDVYKKLPRNVLLPKVKKSFELQLMPRSENILNLKDGSSVLARTRVGSGMVYQLAMPLNSDYSTLPEHELFVLGMLKIAFSKADKEDLAYQVHSLEPIPIERDGAEGNLVLKMGEREVIVETANNGGQSRVWLNEELDEAGVFSLLDDSKNEISKIALNYTRDESGQSFYSDEELQRIFKGSDVDFLDATVSGIKSSTERLKDGVSLWKVFILLSLLFLLIEVLLLRFLKS
ncbi:MAG: vWA domain-containing protein [Bacteroidia bacterium]